MKWDSCVREFLVTLFDILKCISTHHKFYKRNIFEKELNVLKFKRYSRDNFFEDFIIFLINKNAYILHKNKTYRL